MSTRRIKKPKLKGRPMARITGKPLMVDETTGEQFELDIRQLLASVVNLKSMNKQIVDAVSGTLQEFHSRLVRVEEKCGINFQEEFDAKHNPPEETVTEESEAPAEV